MRFVLFILFLFFTLMVSSCGVPKSSTTLKVTNSMVLGNTSYEGGLVFYGRSAGGKFFSVPVAYSAGSSSNTAEVVLDKGTWTFSAVGWASDPDTFEGNSECAVTTVNLDEDEKTVALDLDKANCTGAEFGGNFSTTQFKPYGLITCGTLYTNSATLTSLASDLPDYCSTSTSILPDLKRWAKSARIMIPAIAPGQGPQPNSPLSFCEDLVEGKATNSGSKRLPAKGVPFIVELFESYCADTEKKLMQRYELREGLNFTYPNFDHKIFSTGASSNLYLLATASRRGISSLMNSLPSFSCGSTPCSAIPKTNSYDRVIAPGQSFYLDSASALVKCENFVSVTVSSNVVSTGIGCEEKSGKIFIRLDNSHLTTLTCTSNCSADFLFGDGTSTSTIGGFTLQVEGPGVPSLAAYNLLFGTIGHENITSTAYPSGGALDGMNSLREFTDGDQDGDTRHFGILRQIRDLFNPEGVGGIFSQYQTSSSLQGVGTNISLWEDGIQKSYNIIIESDTTAPEAYLKQNTNPYATTVDHSSFTHKMTISRIIGGAFYPETKLSWVYGKKVGTAEFKNVKLADGKHTTERSLLYWNTESTDNARFETYIYEKEVDATTPSNVLRLKSNFIRAEREAASGEGNARIESYDYESKKDPSTSTRTQRAEKSGLVLKNTKAIYFKSSLDTVEDFAPGDPDVFAREELKPFTLSQSLTPKTSSAQSPNGNHFVSSWAEHNGNFWVIKILRRSGTGRTLESYTLAISSDQPYPKVSINNSGHATVAFVAGITSSYSLFALSWNGSNWRFSNGTTTSSATISSGVISSLSALASSSSTIAFDLIDEDPSSSSSTQKRLIYSIKPNTNWELNHSSFSSGSWSAPAAFSAPETIIQPTYLSLIKVNTSSFHVSWIYTGAPAYNLKCLTTDFSSAPSGVTSYGLPSGFTPSALFSRYNSATLSDLYIVSATGTINKSQYNASTPGLSTLQNFTGVKYSELQTPYCFNRSRDTVNRPTLAATAQTSGCNLPESSYAPAIRNTVLVNDDNNGEDVDHGFKQDIQSLNPATFKSLFTLP